MAARTNPQLATGPQKWVVFGPVAEEIQVFIAKAFIFNRGGVDVIGVCDVTVCKLGF